MPVVKINADLNEDYEDRPVPEGPYDLVILKAEEADSKSGNPMIVVTMKPESAEYPNASPFRHWLMVPNGSEHDRMFTRNLKRFLHMFSLPMGEELELEEWIGARAADALVTLETNDESGDEFNSLRLARAPNESSVPARKGRR